MAMKKCKECGNAISSKAPICPNCGAPNKKKTSLLTWLATFFLLFLAIGLIADLAAPPDRKINTPTQAGRALPDKLIAKHAHSAINVRAEPDKQSKVIDQLKRGDIVIPGKSQGDWVQVTANTGDGWVYSPLLKDEPPPLYELTFNWYKDADFGTQGATVWSAQIQNNSNRYVEQLKVEITTYDKQGQIITSDFSYVSGIAPHGTGSTKGYATYFGTEHTASARIVR